MGSVGTSSFTMPSKSYDITSPRKVSDVQQSHFRYLMRSADRMANDDYKNNVISISSDNLSMLSTRNLKTLQAQIDSGVKNAKVGYDIGVLDKDEYNREMRRLYILQHSLNYWKEKNKDYIGR